MNHPQLCPGTPTDGSYRAGISLIEVIVVIGILAVLAALLMPAVQALRSGGRQTVCRNNLRQLSLATLNYESAFQKLPAGIHIPRGTNNTTTRELFSWTAPLVPFIEAGPELDVESQTLFQAIAADPSLREFVAAASPSVLRCPSDDAPDRNDRRRGSNEFDALPTTHYVAANNVGICQAIRDVRTRKTPNGAFHGLGGESLDAIADGTSHTVLISERIYGARLPEQDVAAAGLAWGSRGVGNPVDYQRPGMQDVSFGAAAGINRFEHAGFPNLSRHGVSSAHAGGVNIALADGSVRYIAQDIDTYYRDQPGIERPDKRKYGIWERLIDLDDGQPLGEFAL